jgi:hypothetical protein
MERLAPLGTDKMVLILNKHMLENDNEDSDKQRI